MFRVMAEEYDNGKCIPFYDSPEDTFEAAYGAFLDVCSVNSMTLRENVFLSRTSDIIPLSAWEARNGYTIHVYVLHERED